MENKNEDLESVAPIFLGNIKNNPGRLKLILDRKGLILFEGESNKGIYVLEKKKGEHTLVFVEIQEVKQ